MGLFQGSKRRIAALQAMLILVMLFVPAAAITMVPLRFDNKTSTSELALNKVDLHRNGEAAIRGWISTESITWDWLTDAPAGLENASETQIPDLILGTDYQRTKELGKAHYRIPASATSRDPLLRPGRRKLRVFLALAALCHVREHNQ